MDIWTKVCAPLFLKLVGLGVYLKVQFFSHGVQWEPLCPAGDTNQSAAVCDSRERVSDVFKLATGASSIYLSRVFAFHIYMHTSHAYTHTLTCSGVVFYSFMRSKRSSCLTTPGGYTSPKPHCKCLCLCSFSLPFLFQLHNVCSWGVLMLKPNLQYRLPSCPVLLIPSRTGFLIKTATI